MHLLAGLFSAPTSRAAFPLWRGSATARYAYNAERQEAPRRAPYPQSGNRWPQGSCGPQGPPRPSPGGGGGGGGGARRERRERPPPEPPIPVVRPGGSGASSFFTTETWAEAGASDDVVAALRALGITRPSHIQAAGYRALWTGGQRAVLLADHAGSGKTLAYLAPLCQLLVEEERALGGPATMPRCPRLLVVVPTAELCAQVLRVVRALCSGGTLRLRTASVTGGHPMRTQREALEGGVDLLVGTPGRLKELAAAGSLRMDHCRAVVFDEADILLGDAHAFSEHVEPLVGASVAGLTADAGVAGAGPRLVFVTATIPANTYLDLEARFPGLAAALGPGLHRTAPGMEEQLIDCSGGDEVTEESGFQRKGAALFACLQEAAAPRAVVFCNKIEGCRRVENLLNRTLSKEHGVLVLPYHSAIEPGQREANLRRFLGAPPLSAYPRPRHRGAPRGGDARSAGQRMVLVCTDRASRGMDSCYVDHVVLFDLPRDPSEYVRRVGRTARGAAGGGLVSVLVLGRQVRLAKEIINRNAKGLPVHRVPPALPQAADGGAASTLDAVREAVEDERRAERAEQKLGQGAAPVEEAEEGAEEDLEWGDEEE